MNVDLARENQIVPALGNCGLRQVKESFDFSFFFLTSLLDFNILYLLGIFDNPEVLVMDSDILSLLCDLLASLQ